MAQTVGILVALVAAFASSAFGAGADGTVTTLTGFVENRGQWADDVLFFAREGAIEATVTQDALVLRPRREPRTDAWPSPLVLRFPKPRSVEGASALPTLHHFILGNDPARHARGFAGVLLREVAPGIDVRLSRRDGSFAYDLELSPGAALDDLVLEVEGGDVVAGANSTVLVLDTAAGRVDQRIGASWQVSATGAIEPVASRFRVLEDSDGALRLGFEAPERDPTKQFVLDPSLVFCTYVGGPGQDLPKDMAVDPAGATYLAARASHGAPTTPGAFDPVASGVDAWVGKLSADGTALLWGTFLGGASPTISDDPVGLGVDHDGTVVVMGNTWSSDFPTTPGVIQAQHASAALSKPDLFITRLAADGSALVWSTFYGGANTDAATALALTSSGDVLIGAGSSSPPPATPGTYDDHYDPGDLLIARLAADGASVVFQTFIAGTSVNHLAVDPADNIVLAGGVHGPTTGGNPNKYPITPGAYDTTIDPNDPSQAYVGKLNAAGTKLLWGTLLGGDQHTDLIEGLAVDVASAVYVTGITFAGDFPVTPAAINVNVTDSGNVGAFATKLLSGGSGLVWSIYVEACCGGGNKYDAIAVDSAGTATLVGSANESNYPITSDAFQKQNNGPGINGTDAVLTRIDPFGEALAYSTWFGGATGGENTTHVGLDSNGDPVIAVLGTSSDEPVTLGAYDSTYGGGTFGDLVVAKFDLLPAPFELLGGGKSGSKDTPCLVGSGRLTAGTPTRLSLRGGYPSSVAYLIAGVTRIDLPSLGGVLVPSPDVLIPLMTDSVGGIDFNVQWPPVPAGAPILVQLWVQDPGATFGVGASNALKLVAQ